MTRATLTLGIALIAALTACKPKPGPVARGGKVKLPIVVRANPDSNAGRPVYVIVRAIDEQGFYVDSYRAMTALVVEPDETVIATFLVHPGMVAFEEIELGELPAAIGVYCMFTDATDDGWKVLFEGAEVIDVTLWRNEIVAKD